ncbi:MAG: zinc ribbon domain-containing protein [Lachnospiraceae bacterium]|nr:zinc ribbon domain-containing protein [Lachnospiraceae bacterium]
MPFCNKCGMKMEPKDSFCSRCGAKACFPTTGYTKHPSAAPMYNKTCPKCQSKVDAILQRCPYCNFEFVRPVGSIIGGMSMKKILSLLALALAIGGIFAGIFLPEIAAFVISIVSLCIGERKEKDAKIFAILALVLSIVVLFFSILWVILVTYARDYLVDGIMKYIFDLIGSNINL